MKMSLVALLLLSGQAFATVDGLTSAWIVTQNVQDDEEFGVSKVAVMGCWGVAQGPELAQFTAPHEITDTMGCGMTTTAKININALSCGKVESTEENSSFDGFKKIVLNISACPYKNNAKFITMIRTAAKRNFPQYKNGKIDKNHEVELVLIK